MESEAEALKAENACLREEKDRLEQELAYWRTRCLELQLAGLDRSSMPRNPATAFEAIPGEAPRPVGICTSRVRGAAMASGSVPTKLGRA
jgi:hypothetical protein